MQDESREPMLPESEVRAMVRVLAGVAQTSGGLVAQKRQLLLGIAELTASDYWMWNVFRFGESGAPIALSVVHNISETQIAALANSNYAQPDSELNEGARVICRRHQHTTLLLSDFCAQRVQDESSDKLSFGQSLFSFWPLQEAEDLFSGVGLHRGPSREPYTARDVRIVHILTGEVGWLHETGVPEEDGQQLMALPPRHMTVLSLLVDGQTPKRIAYHLSLSDHTVRGYIKDIYRHFDVTTRGDLMRRFMVGDCGG